MAGGSSLGATALAMAALMLGLSVTAACSSDVARPTAPSPGPLTSSSGTAPVVAPPTAEDPGLTEPGIRLFAVPRGDGSIDITEEVYLRNAISRVRLRLPESGERLQGMMTKTTPKVTGLQVIADGEPVPLGQDEVHGPRDLPLFSAATKLTLTYRLSGSTVRSARSRTGRASAAIRPMTAADGTLPTDLRVSGGVLLNAVCPLLPETRCAIGDAPRLGIQQGIPAQRALVVLQLDLPNQP